MLPALMLDHRLCTEMRIKPEFFSHVLAKRIRPGWRGVEGGTASRQIGGEVRPENRHSKAWPPAGVLEGRLALCLFRFLLAIAVRFACGQFLCGLGAKLGGCLVLGLGEFLFNLLLTLLQ